MNAPGQVPVQLGVGLPVGPDLDQAGAGGERIGELGEGLEAAMGELEESGGALDADAAWGAQQRLELLAAER